MAETGPSFRTVPLPATVYRVARKGMGVAYSRISPEDDANSKAGHRFDVIGGGVLYVASEPRTTYLETLGSLRPSKGIVLDKGSDDAEFLQPGQVPAQWREDRSLFTLCPDRDVEQVFVDLADLETRTWLAELLREQLAPLGVKYLDVPEVTNTDRSVTRFLAKTLYSVTDHDGNPRFGGIRYASRYDARVDCWAVFDRFPVTIESTTRIDLADQTFVTAAKELGLTVF